MDVFNSYNLIIEASVILILSFLFNGISKRTNIPSVLLLILLGFILQFVLKTFTSEEVDFFPALEVLGIIGLKESARKMAMHIAMVIGLLGLIGTFPGLIKLFALLTGADVARPAAVITQTMMALLCIYYLTMGIKSFIDARKKSV